MRLIISLITFSVSSILKQSNPLRRRSRCLRILRADAVRDGSVSGGDASSVPKSLAIVLATCCWANSPPSANRKYQEFTTVGTVSHSLSRRSNEGATNGPKRLGVGERSVLLPFALSLFGRPLIAAGGAVTASAGVPASLRPAPAQRRHPSRGLASPCKGAAMIATEISGKQSWLRSPGRGQVVALN